MVSRPQFFDFSKVENPKTLANIIGIETFFLDEIIKATDPSIYYLKHQIPKRKEGEFRTVWEVNSPELLSAHKSFQRKFEEFVKKAADYPTEVSHGYIAGKSTFTNACVHAGAKQILHADIQNFFQTKGITKNRVKIYTNEYDKIS